MSVKVSEM